MVVPDYRTLDFMRTKQWEPWWKKANFQERIGLTSVWLVPGVYRYELMKVVVHYHSMHICRGSSQVSNSWACLESARRMVHLADRRSWQGLYWGGDAEALGYFMGGRLWIPNGKDLRRFTLQVVVDKRIIKWARHEIQKAGLLIKQMGLCLTRSTLNYQWYIVIKYRQT